VPLLERRRERVSLLSHHGRRLASSAWRRERSLARRALLVGCRIAFPGVRASLRQPPSSGTVSFGAASSPWRVEHCLSAAGSLFLASARPCGSRQTAARFLSAPGASRRQTAVPLLE